MLHADEGKDTSTFDDAVWSAPLETPVKVRSQWGTHLVLVEGRGAPVKHDDDGETDIKDFKQSRPHVNTNQEGFPHSHMKIPYIYIYIYVFV